MNKSKKFIEISKIEATTRQLETAIILYFNEDDPISIHTLVTASYNILRELNSGKQSNWLTIKPKKNLDIKNPPDGTLYSYFKPEYRKQMFDLFNEAGNFFKHGNRNPSKRYKFYPQSTELHLLEVERELTMEYDVKSFILFAYKCWFMSHYPEVFKISEEEKESWRNVKVESKEEFKENDFELVKPLWKKIIENKKSGGQAS